MPDGGLMPPGPSSETSLQDDSNDNHGNEGLDYPGDLDEKSPESSPLSTKPPSHSGSPPPQYLKKAGLPHLSKIRHDMDEWNRLPLWKGQWACSPTSPCLKILFGHLHHTALVTSSCIIHFSLSFIHILHD